MREVIYRNDNGLEVTADGGIIKIEKRYDFGVRTFVDTLTMTANELSEIVNAWNNLGDIEF